MANRYGHSKKVILLNQTVATNATTSAIVDRLGFDYAVIDVVMPPATATNSSAKWTVLKLMSGDTTAISDAANISGMIGTTNATVSTGTAAEFVIPANNVTAVGGTTAQNGGGQIITLDLDLRGRGHYLFLVAQANASHQTAFAIANLFKGEQFPDTLAERNVAGKAVV